MGLQGNSTYKICAAEHCGNLFYPVNGAQKYCCERCNYAPKICKGNDCSNIVTRMSNLCRSCAGLQKRDPVFRNLQEIQCNVCDETFDQTHPGQKKCVSCRENNYKRKCKNCGTLISNHKAVHCLPCSREQVNKSHRNTLSSKRERNIICRFCSATYVRELSESAGWQGEVCPKCQTGSESTESQKYWQRRLAEAGYRTRRLDIVREFLISNRKCGLCGEDLPIDSNSKHALNSVHVDHIVPKSHGGPSDLCNFQLTHSYCNTSKGNKTTDRRMTSG